MKITGLFVALIVLLAFAGATGAQDDGLAACTVDELIAVSEIIPPELEMLGSLASRDINGELAAMAALNYMAYMETRRDLPRCDESVEMRLMLDESYTAFMLAVIYRDVGDVAVTFATEAADRMGDLNTYINDLMERVENGG